MADEPTKQDEQKEESKEEEKPAGEQPKAEEKPTEKPKTEESKAEKKEKPTPTGKYKDLIKEIEALSVSDLAELVKELEDRFGVSAAAPMAPMGAGAPAAGEGAGAPEAEAKAIFTVHLANAGAQKIAVIKAIREIKQDLGLKEAKDLVDSAPKDIKTDVPKAEAEEAQKKLEAAGAKVELK